MKLTVQNILEKYPTKIPLKNVNNHLKTVNIFQNNANAQNITLDDLQKPVHVQTRTGNKYTYKIREYTLIIKDYPELNVELIKHTSTNPYPYRWMWMEDGTPISF